MNTKLWMLAATVTLLFLPEPSLRAQYLERTIQATFQSSYSGGVRGYTADLDNNGLPDVVYRDGGWDQFYVMLNPAVNGITTVSATYATVPAASSWSLGTLDGGIGEINGDGNLDLVLSVGDPALQLYVWTGNGDGTFATPPLPPLPVTNVRSLLVADVDGDGLDDVIVHRQSAPWTGVSQVVVLANPGAGAWWTTAWSVALPGTVGRLFTGDFDGDGNLDIAWDYGWNASVPLPPRYHGYLWTAYGTGTGLFLPPVPIDLGTGVCNGFVAGGGPLAIDDMDGDGSDDIVAVSLAGCTTYAIPALRVWYGTEGARGFLQPGPDISPSGLGHYWGFVYTGDWDVDGVNDILLYRGVPQGPGMWGLDLHLLRGLGSRLFDVTPMTYSVPQPVLTLDPLPADYDGDGDLDIIGVPVVSTNYYENKAHYGQGCTGWNGLTPVLSVDPPTLGNLAFGVHVGQARPSSSALLGVSVARVAGAPPCTPAIDLSPASLLLPLGSFGIVTTDAAGHARLPVPLPNDPALHGATVFAQWAVMDSQGASTAPIPGLAFSQGRTLIFW